MPRWFYPFIGLLERRPVLHLTGVPPKLTEWSIMPHVAVQARVSELKALLVRPTGLPPERQRIIYRCCSLVGTAVACWPAPLWPAPALAAPPVRECVLALRQLPRMSTLPTFTIQNR